MLKERASEVGNVIWYSLLFLLLVVILSVGMLALNGRLDAWRLSIHRTNVEQSKSFVDANNSMLENYILEHSRLDVKIAEAGEDKTLVVAYKAQQKAIVGKMCREIATMSPETVNANTNRFLSSVGGCR